MIVVEYKQPKIILATSSHIIDFNTVKCVSNIIKKAQIFAIIDIPINVNATCLSVNPKYDK